MSRVADALLEVLSSHAVPMLARGANVKKGEVNIKCPFCGAADPSYHMGINPETGYWACWRNEAHRGKSPIRLLTQLLGLPVWKVRQMLGLATAPDLSQFNSSSLRSRLVKTAPEDVAEEVRKLELDDTKLRPFAFKDAKQAQSAFLDYLEGRGLSGPALRSAARFYDLRYCVSGDFAYRVVLPYYHRGELVTITGRSIYKDATLRYRDLEPTKSVLDTSETLYNYDRAARGGRALIVVEGPFDSLKGDLAGSALGVHVVGLSTNSITDAQVAHLIDLSSAFDQTFIGMDTPTRFGLIDTHKMVGKLRGMVDAKPLDTSSLGKDMGGASLRALVDFMKGHVLPCVSITT